MNLSEFNIFLGVYSMSQFGEAQEDVEEHKRQVGALKRKSQKLVAESQDMKLHLESQQARNADLEKKQRK